jgi:hypothetical protein
MKNNNNALPIREEDINWDELAGIGILRDELEMSGELDALMRGEKTGILSLALVLLGVDITMDATLQFVDSKGSTILEIAGIDPPKTKR